MGGRSEREGGEGGREGETKMGREKGRIYTHTFIN